MIRVLIEVNEENVKELVVESPTVSLVEVSLVLHSLEKIKSRMMNYKFPAQEEFKS